MEAQGHVLLLAFPAQGHINPALKLARRLARKTIKVTFTTTVFATSRITNVPEGLSFASFSDGCDDGYNAKELAKKEYMSRLEREATKTLRNVIVSSTEDGCPVTCVVYNMALPCAAAVAREHHIPAAILWTQPASVLVIYHCYFHEYEDDVRNLDTNDPNWSIQFPGLPLLKSKDLPSFILPSSDKLYSHVVTILKTQFETLDFDVKPFVLVNSLDALEPEALKAIENYNMIPIGPLIPSDGSVGGDLFEKPIEYKEWLDSKDLSSVIYVSFGSILALPKKQMEEIAIGLLNTGRPFLWVIRAKEDGHVETEEEKLSCLKELEHNGMIVPWCSQFEVLSHPSLGCFVSHCGWNSTLESIVCGVPVIAFPHWADQPTNAKLIEDVWRTGVRVSADEDGIVTRDEIVRCVAMVMDDGDRKSELGESVKKWKELANDAVEEGGSSDMNLNAFLDLVGKKQN